MADKAIERARKLFGDGETREAYRILCEVALDSSGRQAARAALAELFPPSKDAVEWSDTVLPALSSPQAAARQKAAKELTKVASDEYGRRQRERIGHPDAVASIVKALKSDDPKVAEASVYAVARVAQFYYRDPRAVQPAVKRLHDSNADVRRLAVRAVTYLTREDAPALILPLIEDDAAEVQTEVAKMVMFLARAKSLPPSMKPRAVSTLLERFAEYESETKEVVVNAVRDIGSAAAIEGLRKVATSERNGALRKRIIDTVSGLENANAR